MTAPFAATNVTQTVEMYCKYVTTYGQISTATENFIKSGSETERTESEKV
jgi:hypothetical protein